MAIERHKEIRRRRQRRHKIGLLRRRLAKARNESERQRLIAKIHSISPYAPVSLEKKG